MGNSTKTGSINRLPALLSRVVPPIHAWAGAMFEQGVLSTLEAFQGKHAQVRLLAGDLRFMVRGMTCKVQNPDILSTVELRFFDRRTPELLMKTCLGTGRTARRLRTQGRPSVQRNLFIL